MGGIQSLLAIGALSLFALVSVRFNSSVLQNLSTEVENKVYLTAFSLADDLIEEIKQKAFDEETVEWKAITIGELSPKSMFGIKDPGETTVADFDDIDDYDGYSKPVSLPHAEGYTVQCVIEYVDINNPDNISGNSYAKRVQVTVASKYLRNPVKLSFIFTLHSK